jgi:protein O-mannosyl-transferase
MATTILQAKVFRDERLVCLGLIVLTVLLFWPVTGFDFVAWDDDVYVTDNPFVNRGLTSDGILQAFTTRVTTHWHPLTMLSHMTDVEFFGLQPGRHHAVALAIHVTNTVLLFLLLRLATGAIGRSALVALLFAIHPLHVETVAWISDRKDLLCTLFGFAALYAYIRFTKERSVEWYIISLVSFVLSILAKSMLITMPFVLLLLDYWPLGRLTRGKAPEAGGLSLRRLVVEKVPFLLIAGSGAVVAVIEDTPFMLGMPSFGDRLANALVSHMRYLAKTVWPSALSPHYVHPNLPGGTPWAMWQVIGSVVVLVAITAIILFWVRRAYATAGWLWFLGTLFTVLCWNKGITFAMADRYTYIPLVGVFIAVAWGSEEATRSMAASVGRFHIAKWVVLSGVVVALMASSRHQLLYWRDSDTLLRRQLTLFPEDTVFLSNLGIDLAMGGKYDEGAAELTRALAVDPNNWIANHNLALLYGRTDSPRALAHLRMVEDIRRTQARQMRDKTKDIVTNESNHE